MNESIKATIIQAYAAAVAAGLVNIAADLARRFPFVLTTAAVIECDGAATYVVMPLSK